MVQKALKKVIFMLVFILSKSKLATLATTLDAQIFFFPSTYVTQNRPGSPTYEGTLVMRYTMASVITNLFILTANQVLILSTRVNPSVSAILYPIFNVQLFLLPQCIPNREDRNNGNHGKVYPSPRV